MNAATYTELRRTYSTMHMAKEVRDLVVARIDLCEALGMTVSECCEMIINQMDEPKRISDIKKLTALAMQTVSEVQNMANYTEAMIVEQHNGCTITVIEPFLERLIEVQNWN